MLGLDLHLEFCFPVDLVSSEFSNPTPPELMQVFPLNGGSKKDRRHFHLQFVTDRSFLSVITTVLMLVLTIMD